MLYPMFFMMLLTLAVGLVAFVVRVKSVKSNQTRVRDFKLMDADFPEMVVKSTRNFNNQFEIPTLFYVACLAYLALDIENIAALVLAWGFVLFRTLHALIHITYNHLFHRMIAFWLAVVMMLGLWFVLIFSAS